MIYPNHPHEEGGDRAPLALSCASNSRILLRQAIDQPFRARLSVLEKALLEKKTLIVTDFSLFIRQY